jgi:hypothetical protein
VRLAWNPSEMDSAKGLLALEAVLAENLQVATDAVPTKAKSGKRVFLNKNREYNAIESYSIFLI